LYFTSKTRNVTAAQIKAGIAMVNVYYDDLYYTFIQESPLITPDILLGAIGILFYIKKTNPLKI
jgi:hypothetical protein